MNIYWIMLIITALLWLLLKDDKKSFVISAAVLHGLVAGLRYNHMHGDLMKYHAEYLALADYSLFSERIIRGGKNTLFYMLNKIVGDLTGQDFQILIFLIAIFSACAVAVLVFQYSENALVSYVIWNCFGFYMFTFYSIKQALAMAIIMFAVGCILKQKRAWFYVLVFIAGLVHFPAFIILPAYEVCRLKKIYEIAMVYVVLFGLIFFYRSRIVLWMTEVYYEDESVVNNTATGVGGKTILIVAIFVAGLLLCSMGDMVSRTSVLLIGFAAIIQMFSVYDNVFTRLADYYFQLFVLLGPSMIRQRCRRREEPILYFEDSSQTILLVGFICLALVYYYAMSMRVTSGGVDDLVQNFAFMWEK